MTDKYNKDISNFAVKIVGRYLRLHARELFSEMAGHADLVDEYMRLIEAHVAGSKGDDVRNMSQLQRDIRSAIIAISDNC